MRARRDRRAGKSLAHPRCDPTLYWAQHRQRKLVRAAARLAARPGSVWHAVYVETPSCTGCRKAGGGLFSPRCVWPGGAETATLSDPSEEKAVLHYAREHNLGKIVIGRQSKRRWWDRSGFADRLARHAPDLDLVVIALDEKPFPLPHAPATAVRRWRNGACSCRAARWRWRYAPSLPVAMQWLMAFEAANP